VWIKCYTGLLAPPGAALFSQLQRQSSSCFLLKEAPTLGGFWWGMVAWWDDACRRLSPRVVKRPTCLGRVREPSLTIAAFQIAVVMAICAVALAVCCALVSTAELKARPTALYGLGSGEEQDADNSIVTTFEVRYWHNPWASICICIL
jgi:hypothetical protein